MQAVYNIKIPAEPRGVVLQTQPTVRDVWVGRSGKHPPGSFTPIYRQRNGLGV
jgi:hypothetical protein